MRFKRTTVYINTNARTEYKEKYLKTFLFSKKRFVIIRFIKEKRTFT